MKTELTLEEKIEYIFVTVKKQESREKKALILKWGFRIFIILYLVYFIKVGLPLMMDAIIPNIPNMMGNGVDPSALAEKYMSGSGANSQAIKNAIGDYFSK